MHTNRLKSNELLTSNQLFFTILSQIFLSVFFAFTKYAPSTLYHIPSLSTLNNNFSKFLCLCFENDNQLKSMSKGAPK